MPFDLKSAREEGAKLLAEANAHVEKYSTVDAVLPTDEDTKIQDARFARLEALKGNIEQAERLARLSFSRDIAGEKATEVVKGKAIAAVAPIADAKVSASREDYAAGLSAWARGDDREDYAVISVTGNAAIVPSVIVDPVTPIKYNCYRAAAAKLGEKPYTYGNTAPATAPVVSSTGGGLVPDSAENTPNDAAPSIGTITMPAHAYQSLTYWWANELINAYDFDVTSSIVPALQGAREYGFASAISTALMTDGTISQSVTTPTHSTIILGNLDSLIHGFGLAYDFNKAIFLNMDVYNACESLTDSNGRPIFEMFTIQDQSFVSYKGVPVFKHDSFNGFGTAGNYLGFAVSFVGFRLRDEQEKLIRYVDQAGYVDKTGLNNVKYMGFGYVPAAVVKLIAGT